MTPRLVALATAVPPFTVTQEVARDFARNLFREVLREDDDRLLAVFDHAGIRHRDVCVPLDWFATDHGFAEKNALYVEHAVRLGRDVDQPRNLAKSVTVG